MYNNYNYLTWFNNWFTSSKSSWFLNYNIQINNNVKSENDIGDNGAKYIAESIKKLKNL